MADTQIDQVPVEQPDLSMPGPEPDDGGSLADHEAQFHGLAETRKTPQKATEAGEGPADGEGAGKATRERGADGKFVKASEKPAAQPERHRAKSQEARAEDAPRIAELTRLRREAERRAEAAERRAEEAERRASSSNGDGKASSLGAHAASAPAKTSSSGFTYTEPKPDPNDETKYPYGTVDPQYVEDLTDWKLAKAAAQRAYDDEQAQISTSRQGVISHWVERRDAAMKKYPDFFDVALKETPPWYDPNVESHEQPSAIHHWIMNRPYGADLLYYLQHPDNSEELSELMGLGVEDQIEALTLLGQRFKAQPAGKAAETGSVAPRSQKPTPRPPNPVRTGPMRATADPPGEDSSLAEHEAAYYPRKSR